MKKKISSLSKSEDFRNILKGKKLANKYFTIFFKKLVNRKNKDLNMSIVTKKKLGNAVKRNKIKRRLKNIMNLAIKKINIKSTAETISFSWKDINQAKLYTLYENGEKIYSGEEARFEKRVTPGIEYCYTLKASSDFGVEGELSNSTCASARTQIPRNIKIDVYRNTFSLKWSYVNGAVAYNIFRNDQKIATVNDTAFQDINLEYDKEYYYKITAVDGLNK